MSISTTYISIAELQERYKLDLETIRTILDGKVVEHRLHRDVGSVFYDDTPELHDLIRSAQGGC